MGWTPTSGCVSWSWTGRLVGNPGCVAESEADAGCALARRGSGADELWAFLVDGDDGDLAEGWDPRLLGRRESEVVEMRRTARWSVTKATRVILFPQRTQVRALAMSLAEVGADDRPGRASSRTARS